MTFPIEQNVQQPKGDPAVARRRAGRRCHNAEQDESMPLDAFPHDEEDTVGCRADADADEDEPPPLHAIKMKPPRQPLDAANATPGSLYAAATPVFRRRLPPV